MFRNNEKKGFFVWDIQNNPLVYFLHCRQKHILGMYLFCIEMLEGKMYSQYFFPMLKKHLKSNDVKKVRLDVRWSLKQFLHQKLVT